MPEDREDPSPGRVSGDGGGESKHELAEERTDWALERTLLAKQRTFGAWLRTGLAAVAVGVGAAELLGDLDPSWVVQIASGLLVLVGAVIFVIGFLGYRETFEKLRNEGVQGFPTWLIGAIALGMLVAAALLLFAVLSE